MSYLTGKVKFYNIKKGYGFIIPDSGANELFIHRSNIKSGLLMKGARVMYMTQPSKNGLMATRVKVKNSFWSYIKKFIQQIKQ